MRFAVGERRWLPSSVVNYVTAESGSRRVALFCLLLLECGICGICGICTCTVLRGNMLVLDSFARACT